MYHGCNTSVEVYLGENLHWKILQINFKNSLLTLPPPHPLKKNKKKLLKILKTLTKTNNKN